jgi:hypothetical protein
MKFVLGSKRCERKTCSEELCIGGGRKEMIGIHFIEYGAGISVNDEHSPASELRIRVAQNRQNAGVK